MYTYQREPEEECARSWTYTSRESDETGGICFMPSGWCKRSHRFPSSKRKREDEGVKRIATELKEENVLYQLAVAGSLSTSLHQVNPDEKPHSHDVAVDLNQWRHRQLSCKNGMTKTGTWHHPVAMLYRLQTRDNKFCHREGIQRSEDGR